MVEAAGASAGADPEKRLAEITELTNILVTSVGRLSTTANALSAALATLDRDSETVAASLQQTSTEIRAKAEIGAILKQGSTSLAGVYGDAAIDEEMGDPGAILAAIFGKYTMAREREVHARVLKCALPSVAETPAAGGADDDIFF
jgi:hypothetical protein